MLGATLQHHHLLQQAYRYVVGLGLGVDVEDLSIATVEIRHSGPSQTRAAFALRIGVAPAGVPMN